MAGRRRTLSLVLRRQPQDTRATSLEALAREAGLHPQLVLRLVRLGLVEPVGGTPQEPLFASDAAARLARAARLRRDVGIDYAGAVLASELLARIELLEGRLCRYESPAARPSARSSVSYTGGGGTSVQRPRARK
jgi:MerR HTH family regulatory protein